MVRVWAGAVTVALFAAAFFVASALEGSRERRHAKRDDDISERLLRLADVTAADVVYDLECGDGHVSVMAAARFGARAVCMDVFPRRLTEVKALAMKAGVTDRVSIERVDWRSADLRPATVVVLYRPGMWYYTLPGQLSRQLRAGTRIVAYRTDLGSWTPLKTIEYVGSEGQRTRLMLWRADGVARPSPGLERSSPDLTHQ